MKLFAYKQYKMYIVNNHAPGFVILLPWYLHKEYKNGYCNKTYSLFQFLFVIV